MIQIALKIFTMFIKLDYPQFMLPKQYYKPNNKTKRSPAPSVPLRGAERRVRKANRVET